MKENFVSWDEKFSVGIHSIDAQHKELIVLTNNLYEACHLGKEEAQAGFRKAIRAAVDYVKFHFSDEEQLMIKHQYQEFPAHKREHEAFVMKVLEGVSDFEGGKSFVPNAFVRYLKDWLLEHIAVTDKELGLWLKAKGVQ